MSKKPPEWKAYQEKAANFFRALGIKAETDVRLQGARTSHDVDVLVVLDHVGFQVRWLVECKHWNRRVSKLQVLALREIVTDLGADKGILLCEKGFQSGAREAAVLTNIQTTSLRELHDSARRDILSMRLRELSERNEECRVRYWEISKDDRVAFGLRPEPGGGTGYRAAIVIDFAEKVLGRALRDEYPFRLHGPFALIHINYVILYLNQHLPYSFEGEFQSAEDVWALLSPLIADLERRLDEVQPLPD